MAPIMKIKQPAIIPFFFNSTKPNINEITEIQRITIPNTTALDVSSPSLFLIELFDIHILQDIKEFKDPKQKYKKQVNHLLSCPR